MGCGGSTPAKEDVTAKRSTQQQHPPQQPESPCLGLEDDYKFKQKLGQGNRIACAACIFLLLALLSGRAHLCRSSPDTICLADAGGTGLTYLAEDRKTKELVAIKLIKRPLPRVLEQNILREIEVSCLLM